MFQDLPSLPSNPLTSLITPILHNGDRDGGDEGLDARWMREGAPVGRELGEISAVEVMASGWRVGLGGSHGEAEGGAMEG